MGVGKLNKYLYYNTIGNLMKKKLFNGTKMNNISVYIKWFHVATLHFSQAFTVHYAS